MKSSGIIYYYDWTPHKTPSQQKYTQSRSGSSRLLGIGLLALALGGLMAPMIPRLRLETQYAGLRVQHVAGVYAPKLSFLGQILQKKLSFVAGKTRLQGETLEPQKMTIPAVFNPLKQQDGSVIVPVDKEFGLIIPKIGVNARIIPNVNPTKEKEYAAALKTGIAHSSFSYMPDEEGTVYLFSHSTNYDWFVRDLNAVFYLLKNLEEGDTAVISYKDTLYTYKITGKKVVKPADIEYLLPDKTGHSLILQTCWPPGSISERLLIFADLIEDPTQQI